MGLKRTSYGEPSDIGIANAIGNVAQNVRVDHIHNHVADLGYDLHHDHFDRYIESPSPFGYIGQSAANAANNVFYMPMIVKQRCTVDGVIKYNSNPCSGKVYVALYETSGELPTNRLAISVQTAIAGVDQKQFIPFTVTLTIDPGYYYIAIVDDSLENHGQCAAVNPFYLPGNVNNGPVCCYEANAVPPAVATPSYSDQAARTMWGLLRVSSVP